MARKQRDHAAEYARRKAKAQAAGYRSLYEARKTRKELRLKPTQKLIPKEQLRGKTPREYRENKDARLWSLKHSRQSRSKFKPGQGSAYEKEYVEAFVNRRGKTHDQIMADLKRYLMDYEGLTEDEWEENY